jgi:hypothetical protein
VPGRGNTLQAPHIQIAIFARGLLSHVTTRLYFPGEALNDSDPLLALVPAGSVVWLETDVTVLDTYGRLLARVRRAGETPGGTFHEHPRR